MCSLLRLCVQDPGRHVWEEAALGTTQYNLLKKMTQLRPPQVDSPDLGIGGQTKNEGCQKRQTHQMPKMMSPGRLKGCIA